MRYRNEIRRRQNWWLNKRQDQSGGEPAYRLDGVRYKGGMNLIEAFVRNVGSCRPDAKGETQGGGPTKGESTDAGHSGGVARSSEEGP